MRRGRLLRALIVSGHCYGPLDPVSNIILNAVLYDAMDEGDSEGELPHDIFDTHAMQDMASCSLDGLVALLCDITATATGAPLSKHEAVEYLWSRQCDLTEKLQQTPRLRKHPQHAMLGSLLVSFSGEKLDRLRYLLRSISDGSGCVISSDDWEQLNTTIKKELTAMIARKELLPFDPQALSVTSRVSAYAILQSLARSKLEELLLGYSRKHPWVKSDQSSCIFCDEASTIVHPPCAARSHLDDDDDDEPFLDYNVKAAIRMWFPKESQYEEMEGSTASKKAKGTEAGGVDDLPDTI
uniref:PIR2-like helical domain-containing protein n=1 Tax=Oryza punctata TaxID=4537 RepID=A0A0E0MKH8_ORYPU